MPVGYTCDRIAVRYTGHPYLSAGLPRYRLHGTVPKGISSYPASRRNRHDGWNRNRRRANKHRRSRCIYPAHGRIWSFRSHSFHTRRYHVPVHRAGKNRVRLRDRYSLCPDSRTVRCQLPYTLHSSIDSKAGRWKNCYARWSL